MVLLRRPWVRRPGEARELIARPRAQGTVAGPGVVDDGSVEVTWSPNDCQVPTASSRRTSPVMSMPRAVENHRALVEAGQLFELGPVAGHDEGANPGPEGRAVALDARAPVDDDLVGRQAVAAEVSA